MTQKTILADFDDEGIYVYQAYRTGIGNAALRDGTFTDGFSLTRMTWIKPSFGWMLYRSGYGYKPGQEVILKIKLSHQGFLTILGDAVLSHYDRDIHESKDEWEDAKRQSECVVQWDPDRTLSLQKLERRAIQLGIRGSLVRRYVSDWIIGVEDVTELAHNIKIAVEQQKPEPAVPDERSYPVPDEIKRRFGINEGNP